MISRVVLLLAAAGVLAGCRPGERDATIATATLPPPARVPAPPANAGGDFRRLGGSRADNSLPLGKLGALSRRS
jgi:hypothetical protein